MSMLKLLRGIQSVLNNHSSLLKELTAAASFFFYHEFNPLLVVSDIDGYLIPRFFHQ